MPLNAAAEMCWTAGRNHCPVRDTSLATPLFIKPLPHPSPHHTTATPPPPHPLSHTSLIRLVVVCCRLRDQLAQAAARPVPKMSASSVESESNLDWGSRQSLSGVNSVVVEEVDSSLTQSVPTGGGIAMVRISSNNLYAPTRHTVGTTSQRPRSFHEEGSFDPL